MAYRPAILLNLARFRSMRDSALKNRKQTERTASEDDLRLISALQGPYTCITHTCTAIMQTGTPYAFIQTHTHTHE